jgi:hypothetical protein
MKIDEVEDAAVKVDESTEEHEQVLLTNERAEEEEEEEEEPEKLDSTILKSNSKVLRGLR